MRWRIRPGISTLQELTVMALFPGQVAIVTGAGRGIGRCEARLLAREGASVVVNDLGGSVDGVGADASAAQAVVDEIVAAGGRAVANYDDCSSWSGAETLVQQALDAYGRLDVLICNAGIVRDRMSFNMTEDEFDAVVRVHVKGHFAPIRFAGAHWRARAKETGQPVGGAVVTTSSEAGLYGNAGQANYVAAKAGIAGMTITLARELERIGVRVNSLAPVAATRILGTVGGDDLADDPRLSPENAAAGAVWLASHLAGDVSGQVLKVGGGVAEVVQGWRPGPRVACDGVWSIEALDTASDELFAGRGRGIPPFFPLESASTGG
jgi:NAD(P)-dependent dehydrogenase (short-subunit alcohol dehydrogenase family)